MANPYTTSVELPSVPSIRHEKNFLSRHREIDDAIFRNDKKYLLRLLREPESARPVNLSEDPLINVLLAYKKSNLVIELLPEMPPEELMKSNFAGDTALHVAAMMGDVAVAEALVGKKRELLDARNKNQEIALHKAALYGKKDMFWKLIEYGSAYDARREDGATVLHCAVMGTAPRLAYEIASTYQDLMVRRNSRAVTPLQLVVTIPHAFRSKLLLGPLDSLIYELIPLEESVATLEIYKEDATTYEMHKGDEEELEKPPKTLDEVVDDVESSKLFVKRSSSKCPPNFMTFSNLLFLARIPARWVRVFLFQMLKQLSSRVQQLEQLKQNHEHSMALIGYLARDPDYWDFIVKGRVPEVSGKPRSPEMMSLMQNEPNIHDTNGTKDSDSDPWDEPHLPPMQNEEPMIQDKDETKDSNSKRWDESPLTLGAKMGLHEFVQQILTVCPQSAKYPDTEGRNFLQLAIMNGHKRIVEIVEDMANSPNPVLPISWLLSSIDEKTKNTILHFAAEETVMKEEAVALQMQSELQWFERVKNLIPKDLEHSRNEDEMTAQELFTKNHKEMVKSGKQQLMEMGKTYSSLVAAVVFASSFSIPGEKDTHNNPVFYHKTAFKIFSHAYVIGLSCASTALVLFLSLLTSPYREQDFRRSLPTKYFFATMSFFVALLALLVAFSCNIYLNIYGGRKSETQDIVPLICELTIFPAVCCLVLLLRGSSFGLAAFIRHVWR